MVREEEEEEEGRGLIREGSREEIFDKGCDYTFSSTAQRFLRDSLRSEIRIDCCFIFPIKRLNIYIILYMGEISRVRLCDKKCGKIVRREGISHTCEI